MSKFTHTDDQVLVQFSEVADTLPGFVWSAAADGNTDFYNREFLRYLGRSLASMQGWTWIDTVHPDDRHAAMTAWNTAIATGKPYEADVRILRAADQTYRWFVARAHPCLGPRGTILRWYGTVTDVHDRVEAEATSVRLGETLQRYTELLSALADSSSRASDERLEEADLRRALALQADSQTRLQLALTAGHLGIWEWNVLTNQINWSPEAARLAGAPADQSTGTVDDFLRRIHPEDRERQWRAVEQALASPGLDYTSKFRTVADNGDVRWLANRGVVLRDSSGRPISMIGVAHDISTEVEQRNRIDQSQRLLHAIVDNVPVSIAYCTTDQRYRLVNQQYAERVGVPPERCIGRRLVDVLGESAWRAIEPKFNEAIGGHQVEFDVELSFEPVGKRLLYACYVPHRGADGGVEGVVVLVKDVTEQRQAENQLRDNDARKAEFMAVLSHELRNYLAPLVTAAAVLRTRAAERDKNIHDVMHRQISQLTRITDDLLDMTRINRGQLDLRPTQVDLDEVIRTSVESVLARSGAKHHTVTVDVPDQPLRVWGDRGRLTQVLTNLLLNAVKFTPEHGTIVIRASRDTARLRVDVSDSGVGIAPDLLPHVFDAFRQADNSGSNKREGMGLGLNIVKKLVEVHGGSVQASSAGHGTGACLTIWLPAHDA